MRYIKESITKFYGNTRIVKSWYTIYRPILKEDDAGYTTIDGEGDYWIPKILVKEVVEETAIDKESYKSHWTGSWYKQHV